MNTNFAKVVAVALVAGVAKALFAPPEVHNHNHYPAPEKPVVPTSTTISLVED